MSTPEDIVKNYGMELGFDVVRITSAKPFVRDERAAVERIRQGLMGGLPWYTEERVRRASRPGGLVPGAKSIVSLAVGYLTRMRETESSWTRGRVARYAWGDDYHGVLKTRLKEFATGLPQWVGRSVNARVFVDDGPMLERAAAERSGTGWFGKSTNIITPSHGSWVFLGQVITDLELKPDAPLKKTCGDCVRCMDACPTGAIVAPCAVDNSRCIAFLTIELRGPIPREMRPSIGDWVFGCDICQEVCPVNLKAADSLEPAFRQRRDFAAPELIPLLDLDDASFRERFRNSPIKRAKRVGLQRNVCVALGNIGDRASVPPLSRALRGSDPLVRGHAAWALGRIGGGRARRALESALVEERDPEVIEEIEAALAGWSQTARSG